MTIHIRILLMFLMITRIALSANDSCLVIDEKEWNKVVSKTDFTEDYRETEKEKNKSESPESLSINKPSFEIGNAKYIFYIVIAGAILFVIIMLSVNHKKEQVTVNQNIQVSIDIQEIEEQAMEMDLEKVLSELIAKGDYKGALRIKFLIVIKLLVSKGKIEWMKEKTNWDYFYELEKYPFSVEFKKMITWFDRIWYGDVSITSNQYEHFEQMCERFKKQFEQV